MDMNKIDLYNVLIKPIVTEKSNTNAEKFEQITFKVLKSATKDEIKSAFEMAFNVKVKNVRLLNVKGKTKKFAQKLGRRSDWKKAYISLIAGQNFNFTANQS